MTRYIERLLIGILLTTAINCSLANTVVVGKSSAMPFTGLEDEPVFGGQVYIQTAGRPDNPAVVIVHGLGHEASDSWRQTIRLLKKDFYVFAFDLPGFGHSTRGNKLYSPDNYVRLINHLTRKYVKKPFHLLGHSMGGAISLRYAAAYPQNVETLTLVDPAGILHRLAYTKYLAPLGVDSILQRYNPFEESRVADLAGLLLEKLERKMPMDLQVILDFPLLREKVLQGNSKAIAGLALVLTDFSRTPERVTAPTLIIWGEKDQIAPLRIGRVLNALIQKSTLRTIPESGHVPYIERPEEFHRLLLQQLQPSPESDLWADDASAPSSEKLRPIVRCSGEQNRVYSGNIGKLIIQGCKDIVIRNAHIRQLVAINSRIYLENSTVESGETAVTLQYSSMTATNGSIKGKVAIQADNSRLDIAGSQLIGQRSAVESQTESTVVFSLAHINSPHQGSRIFHGQEIVSKHRSL